MLRSPIWVFLTKTAKCQLATFLPSLISVALIIKRNLYVKKRREEAKQSNISPRDFSGHSLRAGFATTAAIAGVPEHLIMKQTGHKKSDTIKRYIRLGNMWTDNAATKIGL